MWQTCHKIQTHVGRGEAWTQLLQFSMPGREAGEQGDKENQVECEIKTQRVNADGWGSKEQEKSSGLWACLEGKKYFFFFYHVHFKINFLQPKESPPAEVHSNTHKSMFCVSCGRDTGLSWMSGHCHPTNELLLTLKTISPQPLISKNPQESFFFSFLFLLFKWEYLQQVIGKLNQPSEGI